MGYTDRIRLEVKNPSMSKDDTIGGEKYAEPERNNIVRWFLNHRSGTKVRGGRVLVWEGIRGTIKNHPSNTEVIGKT